MVRAGYGFVFGASTTFTFNGPLTEGSGAVEFDTLGGEREDELWRVDAALRLDPRHAFLFSYYDVARTGRRSLSRDVTFEDTTFVANSTVDSKLDITLYRLYYDYSPYLTEKLDLGLSLGVYIATGRFEISGDAACVGVARCGPGTPLAARSAHEEVTVPLPSVGFHGTYRISPRLQAQLRFDWFHVEVAGFRGTMTEVYLGAELRLLRHFAVGAAYDFLSLDAKYRADERGGWGIQNTWNTIFTYGALYF